MAANKSASIEARLKNSKELVTSLKTYTEYLPTTDDIKTGEFENYISTVEAQITPYRNASGAWTNARKRNNAEFKELIRLAKNIRSEIAESRGENSPEYDSVNSIVKTITGQNVSEHGKTIKSRLKELKEGDSEPLFSSVSGMDFKSRIGSFRSLTGLLRSYDFYSPSDNSISMAALEQFLDLITTSLENVFIKGSDFMNERSRVIHLFDDKGGLKDRAKRARLHVKRKYGAKSSEYKALVNRIY
ncbi:MAG: hypothetical protein ABI528_07675 [bacterium]